MKVLLASLLLPTLATCAVMFPGEPHKPLYGAGPPTTDPPPHPPKGSARPYNTTLQDPIAVFALKVINDYYHSKGDDKPRTADRIINATVQIVSGQLYNFSMAVREGTSRYTCTDVLVLDRPWVSGGQRLTETDRVPTCVDNTAPVPPPPGSRHPYNTTLQDPLVVYALEEINAYYSSRGDHRPRTAVELVNATEQIVEGEWYSFTLIVTDGKKNETCTADVLKMSGQMRRMGVPSCSDTQTNPPATTILSDYIDPPPGSRQPYNTTLKDPLAVFALVEINQFYESKGDNKPRTAVELVNATVQTVQGWAYSFTMIVTDGTKNETCTAYVLHQPWEKPAMKKLGTPSCNDTQTQASDRVARELGSTSGMPDGPSVTSLDDVEVQKAVSVVEARLTDFIQHFENISIRAVSANVTEQVLNGVVYMFQDLTFIKCSNSPCDPADTSTTPFRVCNAAVWWNPRQFPQYQITQLQCQSAAGR